MSASIQCCTCKKYFHLTCGHTSKCLSQFLGEFKSYCHDCVPVDQYEIELFARRPSQTTEVCFICKQIMLQNATRWIYSKCCGSGFTHSKCMKIYALSAGYYLSCIWCKDKRFREDIKYQGVFVPDREANWEKEKGAYGELYRSYKRCDMAVCQCPKGRDFKNAYKWQLITCKFCGSFGAHTPGCIPGFEGSKEKIQEFKCDVCSITEQTIIHHKTFAGVVEDDLLDTSLYVNKEITTEIGPVLTLSQSLSTINTSSDSTTSQETVINVNLLKRNLITPEMPNSSKSVTDEGSFQEAAVMDDNTIANSGMDDNTIANLLVKRLLDMFEEQKYYKK
ncbi:pineapple eye protein-like [Calliphora vicina]|uniref:pineapple eye protein-like n=1 Tax=Calliphora vicina TaxID=7373 RepID=UPI00325BDC3C